MQFVLALVMYLTGFILACCCGGQSNVNDKNEKDAAERLRTLRFNFGIYGFVYMIFKVFLKEKSSYVVEDAQHYKYSILFLGVCFYFMGK